MQATEQLPAGVATWIEDVAGGQIVVMDRRPGGARKEAWYVDVARRDGKVDQLFLRLDRSDPAASGDPWTLRREAVVYQALQNTDVPVPRVIAVHPELQAMLTVRLTGENWFSRITSEVEQVRTAQDFMRHLAALHRIDPAGLDLPGFPAATSSVSDLVAHELDEWEEILSFRGGPAEPALRFSLDWLRRNIPDYPGPAVLVQGDTGPGNFMYADGRVVAVVDWELAHLGDPMDDLAWLSLRAVQEPFTHLPERLAEYEQLSGHPLDEDRIRYYRVMAETKLQVMHHGRNRTVRGDIGNGLIYGMLHRRLWIEALAEFVEIEMTPPEPPPTREEADHEWLYDAVLAQLRDAIVPRITDPLAVQRSKGVARVVKYLAEIDRNGPFFEACELDDLTKLLGERPASLGAGRDALRQDVASGTVTYNDYFGYLWRRIARDNELLRPASGILADRHWPPLH